MGFFDNLQTVEKFFRDSFNLKMSFNCQFNSCAQCWFYVPVIFNVSHISSILRAKYAIGYTHFSMGFLVICSIPIFCSTSHAQGFFLITSLSVSSQALMYHYNNLFTKGRIISLSAFNRVYLVVDMKYLEELNRILLCYLEFCISNCFGNCGIQNLCVDHVHQFLIYHLS